MVLYGADCPDARHRAYQLLAEAARQEWGLSALPDLDRRAGGKPFFPRRPDLEFNLSHSGSLFLCGLDRAPMGVDIQTVKALRPGLPPRVCSPQELRWLEEGPDYWSRFAQLWVCKEAAVKYSGTGLTRSIPGIQVPLLASGQTCGRFQGRWYRIFRGTGWVAAACGQTPPPDRIRPLPPERTLP